MKKNKIITEQFIIRNFLRKLNFNKKESFNFENDAAFLKIPTNKKIIVTNDTIIESVDFFKNDPPESIANKIVSCNLSDISSMGAKPYTYTLSLSLPKLINYDWLFKFTKQLKYLQKKYNFFLIGGDISKSNKIVISSNFFGYIDNNILDRSGSKLNDDIWVTGNLGESMVGLKIKSKKIRLHNLDNKYFINKYLYPTHCPLGFKISKHVNACIDISDGFYGDLLKILNKNKFGASINKNLIPFSSRVKKLLKNSVIDINTILSHGDDYELIFTAKSSKSTIIKNISKKNNIKVTKIGKIVSKNGIYIDNRKIKITNKSFDHFA
tara:strand:- start:652 stop:1623 length:972 start_codon:yes stop_codon:yes gene_type:complete